MENIIFKVVAPQDKLFTAKLKITLGYCLNSLKAYITARSNTLCPLSTNVSDLSFPVFVVWTVVEKDVHENQQWKQNRFWVPTICTHHLCLSKGELGFPRNPTEWQIALHQSQTFFWKNTVLVMTGGRERTEMSEIWMMGGWRDVCIMWQAFGVTVWLLSLSLGGLHLYYPPLIWATRQLTPPHPTYHFPECCHRNELREFLEVEKGDTMQTCSYCLSFITPWEMSGMK